MEFFVLLYFATTTKEDDTEEVQVRGGKFNNELEVYLNIW